MSLKFEYFKNVFFVNAKISGRRLFTSEFGIIATFLHCDENFILQFFLRGLF